MLPPYTHAVKKKLNYWRKTLLKSWSGDLPSSWMPFGNMKSMTQLLKCFSAETDFTRIKQDLTSICKLQECLNAPLRHLFSHCVMKNGLARFMGPRLLGAVKVFSDSHWTLKASKTVYVIMGFIMTNWTWIPAERQSIWAGNLVWQTDAFIHTHCTHAWVEPIYCRSPVIRV